MRVWMGEELESSPSEGLRLVEVYEAMIQSFQMAPLSCGSLNPSQLPCPPFPSCAKGCVTRPVLTGKLAASFWDHFSTLYSLVRIPAFCDYFLRGRIVIVGSSFLPPFLPRLPGALASALNNLPISLLPGSAALL